MSNAWRRLDSGFPIDRATNSIRESVGHRSVVGQSEMSERRSLEARVEQLTKTLTRCVRVPSAFLRIQLVAQSFYARPPHLGGGALADRLF